ncbi:hypothetical protein B0H19DRAFT_55335 [Mycena capillaripes]|nr:hypothetical protein B0H19DRAFT_55335 [Mycena capillaripes]
MIGIHCGQQLGDGGSQAFSFQEGTATILNIHYLCQIFSGFWSDMDDLVKNGISFQLETIVDKVTPIFLQRMDNCIQAMSSHTSDLDNGMNIFDHAHATICEAMLLVVLGQRFMDQKFLKVAEQGAIDTAIVTGMYQNTSWCARTFPAFWRFATWSRVLFSLAFRFLPVVGPVMWGVMEAEFSVASVSHFNSSDANVFDGKRWTRQYESKPATMGSPSYFPFGRQMSTPWKVSEIKLVHRTMDDSFERRDISHQ